MTKTVRLLCVLLAFVFLFCSCKKGSSESSAPEEIVGTWAMINNEEYKDLLEGIITDDIFFVVYYIFESDGTGTTHINDGKDLFSFTYTYDGKTLHLEYPNGDPEDIPCTIKDGEMHTWDGDDEVIFYKQDS